MIGEEVEALYTNRPAGGGGVRKKDFTRLCEEVTVEKVKTHLKDIVSGDIMRYEMPNVASLLFVCYDALLSCVTTSLAMDTHGKALSYALLEMEV